MNYDEDVRGLRSQLGMTWFSDDGAVAALLDLLSDQITLECRDVPDVGICCMADGRAVIKHPPGVFPADVALEEVAHARRVRVMGLHAAAGRRRHRLLLLMDNREEAEGRKWVLAWKLPLDLICNYQDDEVLAADSGCSLAEIAERRQNLLR